MGDYYKEIEEVGAAVAGAGGRLLMTSSSTSSSKRRRRLLVLAMLGLVAAVMSVYLTVSPEKIDNTTSSGGGGGGGASSSLGQKNRSCSLHSMDGSYRSVTMKGANNTAAAAPYGMDTTIPAGREVRVERYMRRESNWTANNNSQLKDPMKFEWVPSSSSSAYNNPNATNNNNNNNIPFDVTALPRAYKGKVVCFYGDSLIANSMGESLLFETASRTASSTRTSRKYKVGKYGPRFRIKIRKHYLLYDYQDFKKAGLYAHGYRLLPTVKQAFYDFHHCDVAVMNTALFWNANSLGEITTFDDGKIVNVTGNRKLRLETYYPMFVTRLLRAIEIGKPDESLGFPGTKPGSVIFWRTNPVKHAEPKFGQSVPDSAIIKDFITRHHHRQKEHRIHLLNVTAAEYAAPASFTCFWNGDNLHYCNPGTVTMAFNIEMARQVIAIRKKKDADCDIA